MERKQGNVKIKLRDSELHIEMLDLGRDGLVLITAVMVDGEDLRDIIFYANKTMKWEPCTTLEDDMDLDVSVDRGMVAQRN